MIQANQQQSLPMSTGSHYNCATHPAICIRGDMGKPAEFVQYFAVGESGTSHMPPGFSFLYPPSHGQYGLTKGLPDLMESQPCTFYTC